jgi:hypothetical protein
VASRVDVRHEPKTTRTERGTHSLNHLKPRHREPPSGASGLPLWSGHRSRIGTERELLERLTAQSRVRRAGALAFRYPEDGRQIVYAAMSAQRGSPYSAAPILFKLPDEQARLRASIADLDKTPALRAVLDVAESRATLAILEPDYLDRDYESEYANHYATTFRALPSHCRRLHFFDTPDEGYRYIGYSVLRPLRAHPTGRTVLAPPPELAPHVSCICPSTVRPDGERLRVFGFPFMEQDSQYGVCAHVSVWMVALYHHLLHGTARRDMSEIAVGAASAVTPARIATSGGLTPSQLAQALYEVGLPPILYDIATLKSSTQVAETVCRYLNSRLPVILATGGHATVLIGYGRDREGRLFYVRSDESEGPYLKIYDQDDPLGAWKFLLVPKPGRIHLAGEFAEREARRIFRGLLKQNANERLRRRLPDRLRLRSYLTQAGNYKLRARERGVSAELHSLHRYLPTPVWVWVVELQDPHLTSHSSECVLGEIVIDATSEPRDTNPLFGYLAGFAYTWQDGRERPVQRTVRDSTPHRSGSALHDASGSEDAGHAGMLQRFLAARSRKRSGSRG